MATTTKNCINCNRVINIGVQFCPHCGARQSSSLSHEDLKRNPYKILQVANDAEIEVIDAAYKSLARKHHPDINSTSLSEEKMKELNWAREILTDKNKRAEWDNFHAEDDRVSSTHTSANGLKYNYESKPSEDSKTNYKGDQQVSPSNEESSSSNPLKSLVIIIVFSALCIIAIYFTTLQSTGQTRSQPVPTNTPKKTTSPNMPKIEYDSDKILSIVNGGDWHYLEDYAKESYEADTFNNPGTVTYTVTLREPKSFFIETSWCALNEKILVENMEHFSASFSLDGEILPSSKVPGFENEIQPGEDAKYPDGMKCYSYGIITSNWPTGSHVVTVTMNFDQKINDGYSDYDAGDYITKYYINVLKSSSSP